MMLTAYGEPDNRLPLLPCLLDAGVNLDLESSGLGMVGNSGCSVLALLLMVEAGIGSVVEA